MSHGRARLKNTRRSPELFGTAQNRGAWRAPPRSFLACVSPANALRKAETLHDSMQSAYDKVAKWKFTGIA
jgi:hypothetical protein